MVARSPPPHGRHEEAPGEDHAAQAQSGHAGRPAQDDVERDGGQREQRHQDLRTHEVRDRRCRRESDGALAALDQAHDEARTDGHGPRVRLLRREETREREEWIPEGHREPDRHRDARPGHDAQRHPHRARRHDRSPRAVKEEHGRVMRPADEPHLGRVDEVSTWRVEGAPGRRRVDPRGGCRERDRGREGSARRRLDRQRIGAPVRRQERPVDVAAHVREEVVERRIDERHPDEPRDERHGEDAERGEHRSGGSTKEGRAERAERGQGKARREA